MATAPAWAQAPAGGRETLLWTQQIQAPPQSPGIDLARRAMHIDGQDAIIGLVESAGAGKPARAWLERRGPAGLAWHRVLEGLPPYRIYLGSAVAEADAKGGALLALAYGFETTPKTREFGRVLAIDLASGVIGRATPINFPRVPGHGHGGYDDTINLAGALRLADGTVLLFGGDGGGPYKWWAGLRSRDGAYLWDVGQPGPKIGEVKQARRSGDGAELLVFAIASGPNYSDVFQVVRVNRAGRVLSTRLLGRASEAQYVFIGRDETAAIARVGDVQQITVRDGKGLARRLGPDLPKEAWLGQMSGQWLMFDDANDRHWFVSAAGATIGFPDGIALPESSDDLLRVEGDRPVLYRLRGKCLEAAAESLCRRLEVSLVRFDF